MNSKTTIIGLVTAIAVLSGAMGLSVTGAFSDQTIAQSTIPATGFLMGHVMIEVHNENGELIDYRLGDNEVVDSGEQCILKMLFSSGTNAQVASVEGRGQYATAGTEACTGVLTGAWDVIAIGTGILEHGVGNDLETAAIHDLYSGLEVECNANVNAGAAGVTPCPGDIGLNRATATTKTWQNGSGGTDTQVILAKTFSATGSANVTESGLFNSTSIGSGGMLSHKTFPAVSLTDGDSITVTWTFVVGD